MRILRRLRLQRFRFRLRNKNFCLNNKKTDLVVSFFYLFTLCRNMSFIEGSCSSNFRIVLFCISSLNRSFDVLLGLSVNSAWVMLFSCLRFSRLAQWKSLETDGL